MAYSLSLSLLPKSSPVLHILLLHADRETRKAFLDISQLWGVKRADYYEDGDGKYIPETLSKPKALLTWQYFMVLSEFSGGWTYVVHQGHFIRNNEPEFN